MAHPLLLNIWHCGVMDNGKGWSAPNYLRLNTLKTDELRWTDDEFRALKMIRCVVNDYPKDIIELKLDDKLHVLLSVYRDRWSTLPEFKPVWSFNYLRTIANFLKDNGYKDSDVVSYWLNDSYVQLFIRT